MFIICRRHFYIFAFNQAAISPSAVALISSYRRCAFRLRIPPSLRLLMASAVDLLVFLIWWLLSEHLLQAKCFSMRRWGGIFMTLITGKCLSAISQFLQRHATIISERTLECHVRCPHITFLIITLRFIWLGLLEILLTVSSCQVHQMPYAMIMVMPSRRRWLGVYNIYWCILIFVDYFYLKVRLLVWHYNIFNLGAKQRRVGALWVTFAVCISL